MLIGFMVIPTACVTTQTDQKESHLSTISIYNLSVMLENQGRLGNAQRLYSFLAKQAQHIPMPFRSEVLKKAGIFDKIHISHRDADPLPWNLPVSVGTDLANDSQAKKRLEKWRKVPLVSYIKKLNGNIYQSSDTSLLELNNYVEMAVIQGSGTISDLQNRFKGVWYQTPQAGGTMYFCDPNWAALVQDGSVKEIWINRN